MIAAVMAADRQRGALPNLIVIGAMKCGTTSLHHYLDLHPEIQMSKPKELKFFVEEVNWSRGEDWYRRHFDPSAPVRGESSPQYTTFPRWQGVAERMHALVPDAKLILVVRDPLERIVSHYVHMRSLGTERREFEDAMRDSVYLDRSRYWMQLQPYLALYPEGSVRVISAEDLNGRRRETLGRVFGFLGVDEGFTSPEFERMWETTEGKNTKFRWLLRTRSWRLSHRLPRNFRWRLERIKYSTVGGQAELPVLDENLRERMIEGLRDDVAHLRAFTGEEYAGWPV
jgi:Sulfotransferase domain